MEAPGKEQISSRLCCGEEFGRITFRERLCSALQPWQHITNKMCLGKVLPSHFLDTT